jgi:hypothetical protein
MSDIEEKQIGRVRRLSVTLLIGVGTTFLCVAALLWLSGAEVDAQKWSTFLNAKLPLIITQVLIPLLVIFLIDLSTPGRTIGTLLSVSPDDPWQHKAVAAVFIIGLLYALGQGTKGGF